MTTYAKILDVFKVALGAHGLDAEVAESLLATVQRLFGPKAETTSSLDRASGSRDTMVYDPVKARWVPDSDDEDEE